MSALIQHSASMETDEVYGKEGFRQRVEFDLPSENSIMKTIHYQIMPFGCLCLFFGDNGCETVKCFFLQNASYGYHKIPGM